RSANRPWRRPAATSTRPRRTPGCEPTPGSAGTPPARRSAHRLAGHRHPARRPNPARRPARAGLPARRARRWSRAPEPSLLLAAGARLATGLRHLTLLTFEGHRGCVLARLARVELRRVVRVEARRGIARAVRLRRQVLVLPQRRDEVVDPLVVGVGHLQLVPP